MPSVIPIQASDLVGTWSLVRFILCYSDGRPDVYPFGPDAKGLIIYSAEGWMSAILSSQERGNFSAQRLESAPSAPIEEKASAFDTYMSYAGTYHLEGDEVVHSVHFALAPNTVGTQQRRRIHWDGKELQLSYEWQSRSGVVRRYQLTWVRQSSVSLESPHVESF